MYLDVWNVSGPTIMVMRVTVKVNNSAPTKGVWFLPLTPQVLVESGKVASINVGYHLMYLISRSEEGIDFPDQTTADANFTVDYFSQGGERSIAARCNFLFRVTEDFINTLIEA